MAEKTSKPKKRMEDYGYKPIMFYLKEEEFEALREYCFHNRLKHSPFIRSLIVDKLKKEGYFKKEAK
ncbi:MAG: hypothetical protein ACM3SR_09170 [Ignavibacteriales bacterium]